MAFPFNSFLALGDSYTIGEAVEQHQPWPVQLVHQLRQNGISVTDPDIIATTGWTTAELQQAILHRKPQQDYSLVSLQIGVNNQYRGYPISRFKLEFEELLKLSVYFAGGCPDKVIVLSIPDYGVTPFAADRNAVKIASEIDHYNCIKKDIAQRYQVKWFDITPISRQAKNDSTLIAHDLLHPSARMYTQWVDLIIPHVVKLLRNH